MLLCTLEEKKGERDIIENEVERNRIKDRKVDRQGQSDYRDRLIWID